MGVKTRAHVIVEEKILKDIDRLVGKKKRSSFITNAAKKELQRLNQLSVLRKFKGAWKDEDHPDMQGKDGTYKWVRKLRQEDEKILRRKLV
jgi:hypothetical protein